MCYTNFLFRLACAIPDGDSVILTGGYNYSSGGNDSLTRVSRYNRKLGWVEDLPELKIGREDHGCASYTKDDEKVFTTLLQLLIITNKFSLLWGEAQLCLPYVCL